MRTCRITNLTTTLAISDDEQATSREKENALGTLYTVQAFYVAVTTSALKKMGTSPPFNLCEVKRKTYTSFCGTLQFKSYEDVKVPASDFQKLFPHQYPRKEIYWLKVKT
jgi:hypothetical protein